MKNTVQPDPDSQLFKQLKMTRNPVTRLTRNDPNPTPTRRFVMSSQNKLHTKCKTKSQISNSINKEKNREKNQCLVKKKKKGEVNEE